MSATALTKQELVEELLAELDVSPDAYQKAKSRYDSLSEWLAGATSESRHYSPHVYPQGSFRLGTVIKPIDPNGDFDLDLGCRLRKGITKGTHTQRQLKELVGRDLERYRRAQNINAPLEPHHRCWRLQYADHYNFHLDAVPSIPEERAERIRLKEAIASYWHVEGTLAGNLADHSGAITDNRDPNFNVISPKWRVSNSEGYALWFESRMKLATKLVEERVLTAKAAKIDDLPVYEWKTPLQRVVQILKRHRDAMYLKDPDSAPISIIITTLAGLAYAGQADIATALEEVLANMGKFVRATRPRVPNPVNPEEDFADRWYDPKKAHLKLEENFWRWLNKARSDFASLSATDDAVLFEQTATAGFAAKLPKRLGKIRQKADLLKKVGLIGAGARTSATGVLGSAGVVNLPHKFYGESPLHPDQAR